MSNREVVFDAILRTAKFAKGRRDLERDLKKAERATDDFNESSVEGSDESTAAHKRRGAAMQDVINRTAKLAQATKKYAVEAAREARQVTSAAARKEEYAGATQKVAEAQDAERSAALALAKSQQALKSAQDQVVKSRQAYNKAFASNALFEAERAQKALSEAQMRASSIEVKLSQDRRRHASALAAVTAASTSLAGAQSSLAGAGNGMGRMFGKLSSGARRFGNAVSGLPLGHLLLTFPAVVTAGNLLVTTLSALVSGLGAVAGAVGPAVGALAVLPQALTGVAGLIGTVIAGFSGIGEAVKAGSEAQASAAKDAQESAESQADSARQVMLAQRGVRDAKLGVADAERNASRMIRDAIRAESDARKNAAQATDAVNEARREAIENLKELRRQVEDTARSEERASLSVKEARKNLQEVLLDPNATALEKDSAALAVEEAQDRLKDTSRQADETRKEYEKARKQGVEKSDAVVAAKKAEAAAHRALADAQRATADAERNAARSRRAAAEQLADAQYALAQAQKDTAKSATEASASQDKFAEAMKNLSPEARGFVRVLMSLKDNLTEIRHAAQRGLLPGLGRALITASSLTDLIADGMFRFGKSIAGTAEELADLITTPLFREKLGKILDSNVKILDMLGDGLINIVEALTDTMVAGIPFTEWLFETVVGWTESWKAMMSGEKGQKRFAAFLERSRESLELLGRFLKALWIGMINTFGGGRESGMELLEMLTEMTEEWADWTKSVEGKNHIKEYFEGVQPTMEEIGRLIRDLTKWFIDMGDRPEVAQLIKKIRTEFGPALADLMDTIGTESAPALIDLATSFVELLDAVGPAASAGMRAATSVFKAFADVLDSMLGNGSTAKMVEVLGGALGVMFALKVTGLLGALSGVSRMMGSVIGTAGKLNGKLSKSSGAMTGMKGAAKGLAGAAGLGLLAVGLHGATEEGNTFTDMLAGAAGGAGIGAMFGPIGALIGAGVGAGLTGLVAAFSDASGEAKKTRLEMLKTKGYEEAKKDAKTLSTELVGVAGNYREIGRAAVESSFFGPKGLDPEIQALRDMDVSMDTIVDATLGDADALKIVNRELRRSKQARRDEADAAKAAYDEQVRLQGLTAMGTRDNSKVAGEARKKWEAAEEAADEAEAAESAFGDRVGENSKAIRKQKRHIRKLSRELGIAVEQYKKFPKEVRTNFEARGLPETRRAAIRLIGDYDELQSFKNIKTLIQLPGVDLARGDIRKLQRQYNLTPKQIRTLAKLEGYKLVNGRLEKIREKMRGVEKTRTDLSAWRSHMMEQVTGSVLPIKKSTGQLGAAIAQGSQEGVKKKRKSFIDSVRTLFFDAETGAKKAIESKSPSKLFARIGRDIVRGLNLGIQKAAQNSPAGKIISKLLSNLVDQKTIAQVIAKTRRAWTRLKSHLVEPISEAWQSVKKSLEDIRDGFGRFVKVTLAIVSSDWDDVEDLMADPVKDAWTRIKSSLADIRKGISDDSERIKDIFQKLKEGIGNRFDGVTDVIKRPIQKAIDAINAMINGYNSKIASSLPGVGTIPTLSSLPGMARGGIPSAQNMDVYPGYTPGKDVGLIGISGGEAIMRPEWTRAIGKDRIEEWNRAARTSGVSGVRKKFAGGFAKGGIPAVGSWNRHESGYAYPAYDINIPGSGDYGNPVRAYNSGVVSSVVYLGDRSYGRYVKISGEGMTTLYAHLSAATVQPGDKVSRGDLIGRVGNVGNSSGPHLHFEVRGGESPVIPGGDGGAPRPPKPTMSETITDLFGKGVSSVAGYFQNVAGEKIRRLWDSTGWAQRSAPGVAAESKRNITADAENRTSSHFQSLIEEWRADLKRVRAAGVGMDVAGISGPAQAQVRKVAERYGWDSGAQWNALVELVSRESSWNPNAANPSSSARGLFQKMTSIHGPVESTVAGQAAWGLNYIKGRHGSPLGALSHHDRYNWYSQGGVAEPKQFNSGGSVPGSGDQDTVPAMLTPGEFVLNKFAASKLGRPMLEWLNKGLSRSSSAVASVKDGVQHFHRGGPVRGLRLGRTIRKQRHIIRALEWMTGKNHINGRWDSVLGRRLRRSSVRDLNPYDNPKRRVNRLVDIVKRGGGGWRNLRKRFRMNNTDMMALYRQAQPALRKERSRGRTKKGVDKNITKSLRSFSKRFAPIAKGINALNDRLGLGKKRKRDARDTFNTRRGLHHALDHMFRRKHGDFKYRPWKRWTPAEAATINQEAANKKTARFYAAVEKLSKWGLKNLTSDLLEKGVDEGYKTAVDAAKDRKTATRLDKAIGKSNLLSADDQSNIIKMIAALSGSKKLGLRDLARQLGMSDLQTVLLAEKAQKAKRLRNVPSGKKSKLWEDIRSYREGTFYAATGGPVPGSGSGDTVPAMLTPGEFVLRKAAVKALGLNTLEDMNDLRFYGSGGFVAEKQFSLAQPPALRTGSQAYGRQYDMSGDTHYVSSYDIKIYNPVAETSSRSLTKALQRRGAKGTMTGSPQG